MPTDQYTSIYQFSEQNTDVDKSKCRYLLSYVIDIETFVKVIYR